MVNNHFWLVFIAALAGLAIGLLVMWLLLRNSRRKQQQYKATKARFEAYRQQVDHHFAETAAIMQEFSHCYHKMVEQWNRSAQQLMDSPAAQRAAHLPDESEPTPVGQNTTSKTKKIPLSSTTDVTQAEVVPLHGQPDQVPDRIGPNAADTAKTQDQTQARIPGKNEL
ncbi:DUF1043 family protein [Neisseriaceae bacterium ESL0693]|nr:DUF1043 family protein [Neisseriaceae bacterium ESL0693]